MHEGILTCTKLALKIGYDFKSYLFKHISVELCNVPGLMASQSLHWSLEFHMLEKGKRDAQCPCRNSIRRNAAWGRWRQLSNDESLIWISNNSESYKSFGKGNWGKNLVLRRDMCVLNSASWIKQRILDIWFLSLVETKQTPCLCHGKHYQDMWSADSVGKSDLCDKLWTIKVVLFTPYN